MKETVCDALGIKSDFKQQLRPQCDKCSRTQSGLVKQANANPDDVKSFTAEQKRLLGAPYKLGDRGHDKGIDAVSAKVSQSQGYSIQTFGDQHGCHTCGTKYAKDRYHADHDPPVFFSLTQTQRILAYANENIDEVKGKLKLDKKFVLKPQCPRCSHEQGGKVSSLRDEVETLAQKLSKLGLIYAPKYK